MFKILPNLVTLNKAQQKFFSLDRSYPPFLCFFVFLIEFIAKKTDL